MKVDRVDTVEYERMEMDVSIYGSSKTLHEGNTAGLGSCLVAVALFGGATVRGEDRFDEGTKNNREQFSVIGQSVPQRIGQREYPLANRDRRDDVLYQVSGDAVGLAGLYRNGARADLRLR